MFKRSTVAATTLVFINAFASVAGAQTATTEAPETTESAPTNDTRGGDSPWAEGVSEAARQRALARYQEGNVYFEQQQYSRALSEYRAAVESWDHPGIRYNMAVCLINLERPLAAFQNLEKGLAYGAAPLGDALHAQGQTYRKLLRGQLAELTVSCSLPEARVSIDGDRQLNCPGTTTLIVEPGTHQVVARRASYMTETLDFELAPGSTRALAIDPRAFDDVVFERRWPTYIPWAVAGAGLLAGAASTPLFVSANRDVERRDQLIAEASANTNNMPVEEPEEARRLNRRKTYKRVAAGSLVAIGGAAAVSGIVMAFLNRPRPVETAPALAVVPTDGGAQVWLHLRF